MTDVLPIDFGGPVDRPMTLFDYADLEQSVPDRFFAMAARYPDRPAVSDPTTSLTYAEAARQVRAMAQGLMAALGPGTQPVAIAVGHKARFPLLMLAVLAAGRPYIPLDPSFPVARNARILEHGRALTLVADPQILSVESLPVLTPDSLMTGPAVDLPVVSPDALAYILFTSGSTGEPKGVCQTHRNLLHDVMQYTRAIHISADDRLSQLYSAGVNGAIRDIYGALLNGASLHVLSLKYLGASGLRDALAAAKITIYHSVPTVFRQVTTVLSAGGPRLDQVRLAYLAGDRLDLNDVETFRRTFPGDALLYTGIGSTENATLYRHWFIGRDTPLEGQRLPVGRALPDRHIRLVDDTGADAAPGEIGEIEVTSRYMALGYLGQPGFPPSPSDPLARVFRTGDLGRLRDDGLLEFHGRGDDQVKIRGHRVEPAAVEAALRALPEVAEGAIHVRRSGDVATALVAYWVARPGSETAYILSRLKASLPAPMQPARAVKVPSLPMLDNFKLDRRALSAWDRALEASEGRGTLADDPLLRRFQQACRELMNLWVKPDQRLSDLNLDSLQWVQVQITLEDLLGRALPADLIVTHPDLTVAQLVSEQNAA